MQRLRLYPQVLARLGHLRGLPRPDPPGLGSAMSDKSGISWTDATKACPHCDVVKPRTAYATDRSTRDGLSGWCSECRNAAQRAKHQPVTEPKPKGPRPLPARDGDRRQARHKVNHLVDFGRLPDPDSLPCLDCGHIGPSIRHEYDHHLGYAPEHHLDVEPVCSRCHHARERSRAA